MMGVLRRMSGGWGRRRFLWIWEIWLDGGGMGDSGWWKGDVVLMRWCFC